MVYVDLNPIRAAMAQTPEESDFTSVQDRIRRPGRLAVPLVPLAPAEGEESPGATLPIERESYLELVEWTGRAVVHGKHGSIELNPVRARMVNQATQFLWSSARRNALGQADSVVTPHATYLALSDDASNRRSSYLAMLEESIRPDELTTIREHTRQGKALGSRRFQEQVEELTGRSATYRQPGRPRRASRGQNLH